MIGASMAAVMLSMLSLDTASSAVVQTLEPTAEKPADADRKVCKMIVPTGTIMAKRFCLTKKEWAELHATTGKDADAFLSNRRAGTCDIKCPAN